VSGHFSVWDTFRALLKLQILEVHTLAVIREDVVGVKRACWSSCLFNITLPGQLITLQTRLQRDVRDGGTTRPALDGYAGSLSFDAGCRDYNSGDFYKFGDLLTFDEFFSLDFNSKRTFSSKNNEKRSCIRENFRKKNPLD